jgi:signal transduction histidine kinase
VDHLSRPGGSGQSGTTALAFASRGTLTGLLVGALSIAAVTVAVAVLKHFVAALGLTGLYLFAVFPVAIGWGVWIAGIVAIASYLTFSFFFVPPVHSLQVVDSDNAAALVISVAAAYAVAELARRAHERAREARLRADDAERARNELRLLADEQAALRRVATLVAEAVPTSEVFQAVVREVGLQCDADLARMERFEADDTVTAIAAWSGSGPGELAVGTRLALEGVSIAARVRATGHPARVDSFVGTSGPIAREAQALGIRASVGCPIVVGGRTWGVIAASTTREAPFPPDTESRIADFTELVATAVSNAEARRDLVASRARLLAASDDARRRVVRDLHDGAQQSLVRTIMTLKVAQQVLGEGDEDARGLVGEAIGEAEEANAELRDLAQGVLPPVLAHGGLSAAVNALVARLRVPVSVDVSRDRFAPAVEAGAYFVVAEALTNMAKHSGARSARVAAWVDDGVLNVEVCDDGVGGARPEGSGLLGLQDRIAALAGRLRVESGPDGGTRIAATLPFEQLT